MSIAKLLGTSNEAITVVLKRFTGVKHRLEYVTTINNRKFYNDSKATNMLATEKALSAFTQPIVLLAGGLDRGNEFDDLIPYFKNVKAIVTFGQTAPKLVRAAEKAGLDIIESVDTLDEAVVKAYAHSKDGDVVLQRVQAGINLKHLKKEETFLYKLCINLYSNQNISRLTPTDVLLHSKKVLPKEVVFVGNEENA